MVLPQHTCIVTMELQKGVVGDEAILPALPVAVREAGILEIAGNVCHSARSHGVRVLHATMRERQGGQSSISGYTSIYYMFKVTLAVVLAYLRTNRRPRDVEVPDATG